MSDQVQAATSKANKILGLLAKTFKYKTKHVWKLMYCAYVRPHLEFDVQAWCPYLKKNIDILEQVQKGQQR
jgi:ribonuclease P/MRP protein subunit RPP40